MVSYLKPMIARKEVRENRRISLRTVAAETGVAISTVNRLANNTIRRVPLDELATLCEYLNCDISDILRLEEVPRRPE